MQGPKPKLSKSVGTKHTFKPKLNFTNESHIICSYNKGNLRYSYYLWGYVDSVRGYEI